jgi:hypothetical protein
VSETIGSHCGVALDEVVLVPPGSIPKTPSGKAQRALCRELYLQNRLGEQRTGKVKLSLIFVRSGVGFLAAKGRKLFSKRRAPD